jgi:hypothetical protein
MDYEPGLPDNATPKIFRAILGKGDEPNNKMSAARHVYHL